MKFFAFLFFLISGHLIAFERTASETQFKFPKEEHSLKLDHKIEKAISYLIVSNKKSEVILKRASDFEDQSLVDAHIIKSAGLKDIFVLGLWYKGAHGQRVTITNLATGKDVFSKNSSWPLDYKFEKGELKLDFLGDTQKNGLPEKNIVILSEKDLQK